MRDYLDTQAALRAVAEGRLVPPQKYAALIRSSLVRLRGHGHNARPELTEAGRERLASPPPATRTREVALMPHAKEHPLAGHRVVTESGLAFGEKVYVIDWIDRIPGLAASGLRGAVAPDAVLVRDCLGRLLVPGAELPDYDPKPVGAIS